MFNKFVKAGRKFLENPQNSVLSAAGLIMIMVVASRVLGLVRQRTLAHFFPSEELSLFFAAFRLPDLVFEVLVFGTFSSAFIPVFSRLIKDKESLAWETAGIIVNIGGILFLIASILLGLHAEFIYQILAPGYSGAERQTIVALSRVLFAAQGFFVVSYVLTGVLESSRRFLVPALAPLFYNLGIIAGTTYLGPKYGLFGPAYGVIIGASVHFLIQLPLASKLGFRFVGKIKLTSEVIKIARFAAPRVLETMFLQIVKTFELVFSSLVSAASYAYFTFGNTLQLLPVGLFGTSIAKAALPTLSQESGNLKAFRKTLLTALYDMSFFIVPIAAVLVVLRIPLVRLVYGTDIFSWEATVQTGYVISAFSLGVVFQAASALLARSFYALHDTKTPVVISIVSMLVTVAVDYLLVGLLGLNVWGLAAGVSIGSAIQAAVLFYFINKKTLGGSYFSAIAPVFKSVLAALGAGVIMFIFLKVFDRSVWIKRLSFISAIDASQFIPFERFVLDTRYTGNLLILTALTSLAGVIVYLVLSLALGSREVWNFFNFVRRIFFKGKVDSIPKRETEPISPTPTD